MIAKLRARDRRFISTRQRDSETRQFRHIVTSLYYYSRRKPSSQSRSKLSSFRTILGKERIKRAPASIVTSRNKQVHLHRSGGNRADWTRIYPRPHGDTTRGIPKNRGTKERTNERDGEKEEEKRSRKEMAGRAKAIEGGGGGRRRWEAKGIDAKCPSQSRETRIHVAKVSADGGNLATWAAH